MRPCSTPEDIARLKEEYNRELLDSAEVCVKGRKKERVGGECRAWWTAGCWPSPSLGLLETCHFPFGFLAYPLGFCSSLFFFPFLFVRILTVAVSLLLGSACCTSLLHLYFPPFPPPSLSLVLLGLCRTLRRSSSETRPARSLSWTWKRLTLQASCHFGDKWSCLLFSLGRVIEPCTPTIVSNYRSCGTGEGRDWVEALKPCLSAKEKFSF